MAYKKSIREEELKNHVAHDFFSNYDTSRIIGNIDFCVAPSTEQGTLFNMNFTDSDHFESLLWAEAKKGKKSEQEMYESLVQLILTIGKARTFDKYIPPLFLGAFDAEKFAFIPYEKVMDVFSQNDFDWTVTPSNHESKEFIQLYNLVVGILEAETLSFSFDDDKELRRFIQKNLKLGNRDINKIQVTKNNFVNIYNKWVNDVKPSINLNWDEVKKYGILDADFYLADLLSQENTTIIEKLYVLLKNNRYELDRKVDEMGFEESKKVTFIDKQKAHKQFWNRYNRPPKEEYWSYIVERRDLLVPQDVRERKGSFFTPRIWVEKSQEYIADVLGENWQDEYYVWDCCAGTGNLLAGLTNKRNIWASTLDQADVEVMKERIQNGANLFEDHVFQFDFLNGSFDDLPKELKSIIDDEEKRKKLVVYINPPYAEAGNVAQKTGSGQNKSEVANTKTYDRYQSMIGTAARELFAQFLIRINQEIDGCYLCQFSKLKTLNAQNFEKFRECFLAKLEKLFVVPANTFDNVKGKFPIGFFVWNCSIKEKFTDFNADVYDSSSQYLGNKYFFAQQKDRFLIHWLRYYYDKQGNTLAYVRVNGPDVQNNPGLFLTTTPADNDVKKHFLMNITCRNVIPMGIYFSIRQCIESSWLNDRDQFLFPNDKWKCDFRFQSDSLIFMLFHGQNNITGKSLILNHWIPFTEEQVGCKKSFESHFMSDFIAGKIRHADNEPTLNLENSVQIIDGSKPIEFSPAAQSVMDAGLELWKYYHQQPNAKPNASFYDIRGHFQGFKNGKMNTKSDDVRYNELIADLRQKMKVLAKQIEPKVYEYGFLK